MSPQGNGQFAWGEGICLGGVKPAAGPERTGFLGGGSRFVIREFQGRVASVRGSASFWQDRLSVAVCK